MIRFVNAKINLGLNIISRRPDGYHNLQTVFYPIGLHNGTPDNPEPFCDILEITPLEERGPDRFIFSGRIMDCPPEKNLVVKAAKAFREATTDSGLPDSPCLIHLEKHLPDGAGMGGGSADASFTLMMLNELCGSPLDENSLTAIAASLGADCPFFITNHPAYAEGIGERLTPVDPMLDGLLAAIVKPELSISTKEAFAGISPRIPAYDTLATYVSGISHWKDRMTNDFEHSLFPIHQMLPEIKRSLYEAGALYAAMSGSGSTIFGIFSTRSEALAAIVPYSGTHYTTVCRL